MSLISLRNFTAPLRSKFQIGGLIIGALLVLVIRLAGGGTYSGDGTPQDFADRQELDQNEVSRRNELNEILRESLPARRAPAKRAAAPDDILDGLVGENANVRQKPQRGQDPSGNSFDDIRRSLGIE
jgi:hypothetical protein